MMRQQQSDEDQGADEFLLQEYEHFLSNKAEGMIETIPERGQTGRLVEKSLSWCIQNSKMILFQQTSTLPPFWNGLQALDLLPEKQVMMRVTATVMGLKEKTYDIYPF